MNVEKIIKKVIGKSEFELSTEVPWTYIIHRGVIHIFGLFNGVLKKPGLKGSRKRLFVGRKVRILSKSQMTIGNNVRIGDYVTIDALSEDGVTLEDKVKIGESSKMICSGTLSNLGKGIIIGRNTSFAENTFFGAAGGIEIGRDVISGQNVRFHAENHNFKDSEILIRLQGVTRKGIKIGNNVWIGSGVVFLDGCDIADGCVIAANSVVNKKFPKNSIIAGCPGRILRRERSEV